MQARFRSLFACILLAAFSVFLIPKEFVHALYNHTDTHETISPDGETAIGAHHIHCDFLSYEASLFTLAGITHCPFSAEHHYVFVSTEAEQVGVTFACHPSLRGPPLC